MKFDHNLNLDVYIILLIVGVATFMIGMSMMSSYLKKVTGKGVKRLFKKTENNVFAGMGIGAATTALIQSSAATSIMAIGFLSAGAMSTFQGVSVILGAYLGTTITGVLASFSALPISTYLLLLSVVGVIMSFFKNETVKNIGGIFSGLGLLFFGLGVLSAVFKSSTEIQGFIANLCTTTEALAIGPILLWLVGVILTVLSQSSSATSSIIIIMVSSGALNFSSGIYLILGATVGTVVPTVLASLGGNVSVKRTTFIAVMNRIICSVIALAIVWPLSGYVVNLIQTFFNSENGTLGLGLAIFLVVYNVIFLLLWVPLLKPIVKLVERIIPDKDSLKKQQALKYIDEHLLNTPTVAMMQVKREILAMLQEAFANYQLGYKELTSLDLSTAKELIDREEKIDYINNAISEFLIPLAHKVGLEDERKVGSYFHMINDIERIGDHAYNFHERAETMKNNELSFSETAINEFKQMDDVLVEMFSLVIDSFTRINRNRDLPKIHALEEKTDQLKIELSKKHFDRMTHNECKPELSPYYSTFVSELERIADHLVNIGYAFLNPTGEEQEIPTK